MEQIIHELPKHGYSDTDIQNYLGEYSAYFGKKRKISYINKSMSDYPYTLTLGGERLQCAPWELELISQVDIKDVYANF